MLPGITEQLKMANNLYVQSVSSKAEVTIPLHVKDPVIINAHKSY